MSLQKSRFLGLLIVLAGAGAGTARAQDAAKQEARRATEGAVASSGTPQESPSVAHHFVDKENRWLFAGVGAARTLDYFSTLNMRRRGRREIFLNNDLVDNHPAFAAIEAAATGTSIGVSYLFHRYGHHKLERCTSFVHIGLTTTGAVRNYCLKTAHRKTTP
ncbi:MAG: hypothetical protein DMG38_24370 [Acidobacteria bacterium]|nr:MAG: hypothetical protein DMG38_24370 [Acidobacteriota bacterium]